MTQTTVVADLLARIEELERPILCAKCNDHIIADDGAVCEICADTMDTIITELQARIEELDNELSALRTKWDELPAFLVKQDEADIFDEHNLNMLLIEYILDIKPEEK